MITMGKDEFLFLKSTRNDALTLEREIVICQEEIDTHQQNIAELENKIGNALNVDYKKKIAGIKASRTKSINNTEQKRKLYEEKLDRNKKAISELDKQNLKMFVGWIVFTIVWGILIQIPSYDPIVCENGEKIENSISSEGCPEWEESKDTPVSNVVWGGSGIVAAVLVLIAISQGEAPKPLPEKNKEIEEELRELTVNKGDYDRKILNLKSEEKRTHNEAEKWEEELGKELASTDEKISLVTQKNSELLKLLRSIEHLVP